MECIREVIITALIIIGGIAIAWILTWPTGPKPSIHDDNDYLDEDYTYGRDWAETLEVEYKEYYQDEFEFNPPRDEPISVTVNAASAYIETCGHSYLKCEDCGHSTKIKEKCPECGGRMIIEEDC